MFQVLKSSWFTYLLLSAILAILPFTSLLAGEGQAVPFKLKQNEAEKLSSAQLNQRVESLLFEKTQEIREKKKLPPLEENALLKKVARGHSSDMLKRHYFSHFSPEGKDVLARIQAQKKSYDESCSENLHQIASAEGLKDPTAIADQMIKDWLGSTPHRRNLLSTEYRFSAVGCATDGKAIFCTQVFSGPDI